MTFDAVFVLVLLVVLVYLFLTEKFPVDLTALAGLMIFVVLGYVSFEDAFSGFSSTAVITMIGTFFLGAALRITGVAEQTAAFVNRVVGSRELFNIIAVMVLGATLSAFMSNVAATALLLPATVSIAHRAEISPSKLLIPLSFATVLGGSITIIGTMPNILISEIMREKGLAPFQFFDFSPYGLALVAVGILYFVVSGRRHLPEREALKRRKGKRDLKSVYRLTERLFSLRVPRGSAIAGKTLSDLKFGTALDAHVVTVLRGDKRVFAPTAGEVLREGDLLLVRGKLADLRRLLRFRGAHIRQASAQFASHVAPRYEARSFSIKDHVWEGAHLREMKLRQKYRVIAAVLEREDSFRADRIADESLALGDRIHVLGSQEQLQMMEEGGIVLEPSSINIPEFFASHAFTLQVTSESPLVGTPLKESQIVGLLDLNLLGLHREMDGVFYLSEEEEIVSGDNLVFVGERAFMRGLVQLGELEIESTNVDSDIESSEVGVVEAILSPRSKLIDKTIRDINFSDKYGFHCLALWRQGRPIRSRVAREPLHFGDALLLRGPRRKIAVLAQDPDFVVLTDEIPKAKRVAKAPVALGGLFLTILLAVFQVFPAHIATFAGATFVALFGAIHMREAYREVEWRVIFLVACLIPIGNAVGDVGLVSIAAESLAGSVGTIGPLAVLIAFSLLSSLLSQTLDGTLTIVLLAPITIESASSLGISPYPLLMAVAISASIAFLTPFSHKAHLLVMGAGGYRAKDYFKVGVPVTILAFLALWIVIPMILPF
ncbi:MAG: SLC13 family permease [Bdellovibrionales bacterium]|nr:SLC13 family permease [Bdellovibrionales bacterium]